MQKNLTLHNSINLLSYFDKLIFESNELSETIEWRILKVKSELNNRLNNIIF